jgi:hypothetical protein
MAEIVPISTETIRQASSLATKKGKPHGRDWARNNWKAAGISEITLYQGTRHSLASQTVNNGASIYAVCKFLGH